MLNSWSRGILEAAIYGVSVKNKLPYAGNLRSTSSLSFSQIDFMTLIRSATLMLDCFCSRGTPVACSVMMYSLPMAFEASSDQPNISGMGMLVLACTIPCSSQSPISCHISDIARTVLDGRDLGTSHQSRWPGKYKGQRCNNSFGVVSAKHKNSFKPSLLFIARNDGVGARTECDDFTA